MSTLCFHRLELVGGKTAVVTLCSPGTGNRLTLDAMAGLMECLDGLRGNCSSLVIRGEGGYFCAGGDVAGLSKDTGSVTRFAGALKSLFISLARFPAPVIACIEGHVEGGGICLLAASDIAVAWEGSRFAIPEMRGGMPPVLSFVGASRFLPRKKLMELALYSGHLSAGEALGLGLLNRVVSDREDVFTHCMALSEALSGLNPSSVEACKQLLGKVEADAFEEDLDFACGVLVGILASPKGA